LAAAQAHAASVDQQLQHLDAQELSTVKPLTISATETTAASTVSSVGASVLAAAQSHAAGVDAQLAGLLAETTAPGAAQVAAGLLNAAQSHAQGVDSEIDQLLKQLPTTAATTAATSSVASKQEATVAPKRRRRRRRRRRSTKTKRTKKAKKKTTKKATMPPTWAPLPKEATDEYGLHDSTFGFLDLQDSLHIRHERLHHTWPPSPLEDDYEAGLDNVYGVLDWHLNVDTATHEEREQGQNLDYTMSDDVFDLLPAHH
jgi:hypothetical protein